MLSFKAGKLAAHFSQWHSLTSDPQILETVSGCKIEFDTTPSLNKVMVHTVLSETKQNLLTQKSLICCVNKQLKPVTMRPGNTSPPSSPGLRKMDHTE